MSNRYRAGGFRVGLSFIVLVCFILIAFYPALATEPPPLPTKKWPTASPQSQGVSPAKLEKVTDLIAKNYPKTNSLLVVKNGWLVWERYFNGYNAGRRQAVFSVTKSVISALTGMAMAAGKIKSLDQKVSEFLPEYFKNPPDPRQKNLTLRHLLTMTAGQDWAKPGDANSLFMTWYSSPDFVAAGLKLRQIADPGKKFVYASPVAHIMSVVLSKALGATPSQYVNQRLFAVLGIKDPPWDRGPNGVSIGAFGLSLSPREMAKFGLLYLRKGRWQGRQIVPAKWVAESTAQQGQTPNPNLGYGYYWWVSKLAGCKVSMAIGNGEQYIMLVPRFNLLMVTTSQTMPPRAQPLSHLPVLDMVLEAAAYK